MSIPANITPDSVRVLFEKGTYFGNDSIFALPGNPIPGAKGEIIPYMLSHDYELYFYSDIHMKSGVPHTHKYYEFYFFIRIFLVFIYSNNYWYTKMILYIWNMF